MNALPQATRAIIHTFAGIVKLRNGKKLHKIPPPRELLRRIGKNHLAQAAECGILIATRHRREVIAMLPIGTQAPSFALPDQNGQTHTLEEYRGQKVVLYFYPKDNTAGLHQTGLRLWRALPAVHGKGRGGAGREQGQRRLAQEVRGKVRPALHHPLRRGPGGDQGLRRLAGKEHVRQKDHGRGAHHLPHRRKRRHRPRLSAKSRRGRTRSRCWTCCKEDAYARKTRKDQRHARPRPRQGRLMPPTATATARPSAAWRWRACWGRTSGACSRRW